MWHRVKDLWRHNRIALLAFIAVICVAGFFGVKTAAQAIYWADPAHQDQQIAAWMTPRYVGQSYRVPPRVIQEALDLDAGRPPGRITLDSIAARQGITLAEMQARVDAAVAYWRAEINRPDK